MCRLLAVVLFSLIAVGAVGQVPALSIEDRAHQEGSSISFPFSQASYLVTLSQASTQPVSVDWTIEYGTANAGDVGSTSGTLVIPARETSGRIAVIIRLDFMPEPDETFFINLSNPVNATILDGRAQITLLNDDIPPVISISNRSATEGHGSGQRIVFDVPASLTSGSIDYATSDDTAIANADYIPVSGTVTISLQNATITVQLIGDTVREPDETFFLNFSNPVNVLLGQSRVTGTIINDDFHSDLAITKSGPSTAIAGAPLTYSIVVSNAGPDAASNVVVTDILPAGATFVSATPSQGACSGTNTVTCNLGTMANGASANIALTILAPNTPQTFSNTASVTTTSALDPNPANNTSPAVITAPAAVAPIPTLSTWALLALLAAVTSIALLKVR